MVAKYRRLFRRLCVFIALLLLVVAVLIVRPAWHLWRTSRQDVEHLTPPATGFTDDASRMNLTAVQAVKVVSPDIHTAEEELAAILKEAAAGGLKISIAGARHSMGGQTMYPGGIVIDLHQLSGMSYDAGTKILNVGAGALWHDILRYLDPLGRSVGVMQSNDSFSVGGSISVNCHGWQIGRPPIVSTVKSFRIMLADGTIKTCSRNENKELFSAALGGYGLFGIILDADLVTVPNRLYHVDRRVVPSQALPAAWESEIASHSKGAEMVYGRLNVMPSQFLSDAIVYVLYVEEGEATRIPAIHDPKAVRLQREILRGAAEDDYGKKLRWQAELNWQPVLGENAVSRNQVLSEGVEIFQNRSSSTTDILHEYFVPRERFGEFVTHAQEIIPRYKGNLLNVTVRSLEPDSDTLLRYAREPIYSLVMLFQQGRDQPAENQMAEMTRELVDAAFESGGTYYLPYRLHATVDQFRCGYPQWEEFFTVKRKYDPAERFENQLYLKYGLREEATIHSP
jgi:FAD/FMN-containing dehydrogenase